MDQLEAAGIVGAAQGSKPREVLLQDENQLNTLLLLLVGEVREIFLYDIHSILFLFLSIYIY